MWPFLAAFLGDTVCLAKMFSNCTVGWQDKFEDAKLHFEERQSSKKYIKITHFILGNRWNLSVTHYWRQILFMIVCPNFNFILTWRILNLLLLPNLNNRNVIRVSGCTKDKFHAMVSLLILVVLHVMVPQPYGYSPFYSSLPNGWRKVMLPYKVGDGCLYSSRGWGAIWWLIVWLCSL
jgi:hypothetical protein